MVIFWGIVFDAQDVAHVYAIVPLSARPETVFAVLTDYARWPSLFGRSCVEYATALHELGEPYSKAIAILRLSTLYGLGDPRFVATLGGMCFMSNNFTEAQSVFSEAIKRQFPAIEAQRIQFRPRDPQNLTQRLRVPGRVVTVKPGYVLIEHPGYPRFLCPGSRYSGLPMRHGLELTFEPAFSARGALADRPAVAQ
ncbi:MAG TPA: hypothetical protein VFI05_04995 [Nitrospiraceae bacterium]|nr:hypothetical protein [Nitrospiraceae bacterium]